MKSGWRILTGNGIKTGQRGPNSHRKPTKDSNPFSRLREPRLNFTGFMPLKSPKVGDLIRLRKGILLNVKVREWNFLGKTKSSVILFSHKPKGRILKVVKEDDIDWEDYGKEC